MKEYKERLKVTGQGIENARGYLTVSYKGEEYRVQKFTYQQRNKWCPDYVNCMIKELGNNSYSIMQDLNDVVPELYRKGGVYPFLVTAILKHAYQITDENGLRFRLTQTGGRRLSVNRNVRCEVTDIQNGFHVIAKLVEEKEAEKAEEGFVPLDSLSKGMDLEAEEAELLKRSLFENPHFREARLLYEGGNTEWLLTAAKSFDTCLSSQIEPACFLNVFKRLSLYLIEGSGILNGLPDERRTAWMECLTTITQHAEDYQMAYDLIARGEAAAYVRRQLNNLRESENLYQPDRKFRTILCVFNSDAKLMEKEMDEIFDIILHGRASHWQAEPFRSAFVNMLEIFISKYKDRTLTVGLSKVIKALAIQLKLSREGDGLNRRLNKSMLYRFISQVKKEYSVPLLDKSLESLLTPYVEELEYEWEDIFNIEYLYTVVAANIQVRPLNNVYQVFRGQQAELLVEGNHVTIRPQKLAYDPFPAVPKKQLQWNDLKILVNEKPAVKLKGSHAIYVYKQYWDAVEQNLFTVKASGYDRSKVIDEPRKGDFVAVRVEKGNLNNSSFLCHIEHDELNGSGWLDLKSIVGYLNPSADLINCFASADGVSYLLPVKVIADPDSQGMYHFSMQEDIKDHMDSLLLGEEVACKVQDETADLYIGFTSNGFSVRIPKDSCPTQLKKTEVVVGKLIERDWQRGQLVCEFVKTSLETLDPVKAMHALLESISLKDEEYDEEDGSDSVVEETLDKTTVREIVSILDRMAVLMPSRHETYNYLAVSGILARMAGEPKLMDYYKKRKSILLIFDEYERSGKVDENTLRKIKNEADGDLVDGDSMINNHITLFTILNAIDDKTHLDELYNIYQRSNGSDVVSKACAAAMTLLLMSDFNLPEAKKQVFDAMNNEIGVKFKTADRKDYGRETQTVEFKSSVIYPAGNGMRPYPRLQEIEIMKVICSFLNSDEGGTLYVGVNNYGVACGLENDFRYIGSNDLEAYGRNIHHRIYDCLGALAADCCKHSDWEKADGYDVFRMTIEPCNQLVAYNGKYYVRFNTEKRIISEEEVDDIRARHDEAYAKWKRRRDEQAEKEEQERKTEPAAANPAKAEIKPAGVMREIATSAWRKNIVMPYEEECGQGVCAFLHFYDGSLYAVSDAGIYDSVQLSLAIADSEADGYVAVVYKSGKILAVETSKILALQRDKKYKRSNAEEVVFACPAHKGDAILTLWHGPKGEAYIRIDTLPELVENHHDGNLSSAGKMINEYLPEDGFVGAEIVAEDDLPAFSKFRNKGNGLGYNVSRIPADSKALLQNKLLLDTDSL